MTDAKGLEKDGLLAVTTCIVILAFGLFDVLHTYGYEIRRYLICPASIFKEASINLANSG